MDAASEDTEVDAATTLLEETLRLLKNRRKDGPGPDLGRKDGAVASGWAIGVPRQPVPLLEGTLKLIKAGLGAVQLGATRAASGTPAHPGGGLDAPVVGSSAAWEASRGHSSGSA
jgi:hypothetical protein